MNNTDFLFLCALLFWLMADVAHSNKKSVQAMVWRLASLGAFVCFVWAWLKSK